MLIVELCNDLDTVAFCGFMQLLYYLHNFSFILVRFVASLWQSYGQSCAMGDQQLGDLVLRTNPEHDNMDTNICIYSLS